MNIIQSSYLVPIKLPTINFRFHTSPAKRVFEPAYRSAREIITDTKPTEKPLTQAEAIELACKSFSLYGPKFIKMQQELSTVQQRNIELEAETRIDNLMQIGNRKNFEEKQTQAISSSIRTGESTVTIIVDVDSFKFYNDLFGHLMGNMCLQRIATAIGAACNRPLDSVSRYGGEEIAVVALNTDLHGAQILMEGIRQNIHDLKISHPNSLVKLKDKIVTVSAGIATYEPNNVDLIFKKLRETNDVRLPEIHANYVDFCKNASTFWADALLYRVKKDLGRNTYQSISINGLELYNTMLSFEEFYLMRNIILEKSTNSSAPDLPIELINNFEQKFQHWLTNKNQISKGQKYSFEGLLPNFVRFYFLGENDVTSKEKAKMNSITSQN